MSATDPKRSCDELHAKLVVRSPLCMATAARPIKNGVERGGDAKGRRCLKLSARLRNVADDAFKFRRFVADDDETCLQRAPSGCAAVVVHACRKISSVRGPDRSAKVA